MKKSVTILAVLVLFCFLVPSSSQCTDSNCLTCAVVSTCTQCSAYAMLSSSSCSCLVENCKTCLNEQCSEC